MISRAMRRALRAGVGAICLLAACGGPAAGEDNLGSWPQFHGPSRDNLSPDKGLLKQWPAAGPRLLWRSAECGTGYACVSIAAGRIFVSGDFADKEMVVALDPNGRLAWKAENGASWKGPYPGSRTTPTFSDGLVYQMNPTGRLAAWRADTGQEVWAVDLKSKFGAQGGQWALAENVIVEGRALLCTPGGKQGRVVALDKATGSTIWVNTEIDETAAYSSPIVVTHNGVRQMIALMQKSVVGVDVRTGKCLWSHKHETQHDQNVTMPLFHDGCVYVTSGHAAGGRLLRLEPGGAVKQLWAGKDQDNCHGGVLLIDGYLYGSGCRLFGRGLVCLELLTGKKMWNEQPIGKVSVTAADGLLYCLNDRGRMSLVDAGPDHFKVISQFDLPRANKKQSLAHPVVCGGRLYVRYWDEVFVFDVRG